MAIRVDGAPDCVVFGRCCDPDGVTRGTSVFIGVRPEDIDIVPATSATAPPGMIGGEVSAALFIGERIEYQMAVDGQRMMITYGDRHDPLEEGAKAWLRLRPEGHSAWPTDRA